MVHAYRGRAGDVVIFHPWAIHAASRNYTERNAVRFMCNATVRYAPGKFKDWFTPETAGDLNVRAAMSGEKEAGEQGE